MHDLYQELLEGYDTSVEAHRASPAVLGIAESEWPAQIQPNPADKALGRKKDVALSAFEKMEFQLTAKREKKKTSVVMDVDTSARELLLPCVLDETKAEKDDYLSLAAALVKLEQRIPHLRRRRQGDRNAALLKATGWVVFSRK